MKARGLLGVLASAAALGLAPAAEATPSYFVKPKGLHLSASLPASNGYAASIVTSGHRKVVLTFSQGSYQITYTTLGKVTRGGISADFGHLGHVSLRFRAKRPPEALPLPFLMRECKGRTSTEEQGVLLGNVQFRGERGFTRIRSQRVKGQVARFYRRVCKGPAWLRASASRTSEPESYVFFAVARGGGQKRTFGSVESGAIGLAVDVATLESKVDDVAIVKTAFTLDESVFRLSPPGKSPVRSRMVPGWPFLGSAIVPRRSQPAAHLDGVSRRPLPRKRPGAPGRARVRSRTLPIRLNLPVHPLPGRLRASESSGSGQRLPLPALGAGQAFLAEVAAELV